MSYDLMVFRKESAPNDKKSFMEWYNNQTEWTEDHSYDDPANTSADLKNWFMDMKESFPAMNGPYASDDVGNPKVTYYSIGREVIYAAFAWSEAKNAYPKMIELAEKHNVGFFDASGSGDIFIPGENGKLQLLNKSNTSQRPWWKFW